MLLDNFYTTKHIQQQPESTSWDVQIELNPKHPVYGGHFPSHPVVPGVCLLQIIKETSESIRNESLQYVQVGSCKFLSAIEPSSTPNLLFTLTFKETAEGQLKLLAEGFVNEGCFIKLKAVLLVKTPVSIRVCPDTHKEEAQHQ